MTSTIDSDKDLDNALAIVKRFGPLTTNARAFANACVDTNCVSELLEAVDASEADENDREQWNISPAEWRAAIATAILEKNGSYVVYWLPDNVRTYYRSEYYTLAQAEAALRDRHPEVLRQGDSGGSYLIRHDASNSEWEYTLCDLQD